MAKTRHSIEKFFLWPKQRPEIDEYVRNCPVCRANKASNQKPGGLLQPLPIPEMPWDSVSFDFIHDLPVTERGFTSIVVLVDRLTKYAYFHPCHNTIDAKDFAEISPILVIRAGSSHSFDIASGIVRNHSPVYVD